MQLRTQHTTGFECDKEVRYVSGSTTVDAHAAHSWAERSGVSVRRCTASRTPGSTAGAVSTHKRHRAR